MRQSHYYFDSDTDRSVFAGFRDFDAGLSRAGLALHLGMQDIRLRYRRTILGPIWTLLNSMVFVGLIGLVYSLLFRISLTDFLPYFAAGYFVWITVFSVVMESGSSFIAADTVIKSVRVPYTVHILRCLVRNLITFLHMLPVPIIAYLLLGGGYVWQDFLFMIWGFVILGVNSFWVGTLVALMATRYRDFQQIVATALQIFFFTTPIFWTASLLDGNPLVKAILATYNPVFQQIEVLRGPMIGLSVDLQVYLLLSAGAIAGTALSLLLLGLVIRRISIWL